MFIEGKIDVYERKRYMGTFISKIFYGPKYVLERKLIDKTLFSIHQRINNIKIRYSFFKM